LRLLIDGLSFESQTATDARNAMTPEQLAEALRHAEPERGRWSRTEMLLADIEYRLRVLVWQQHGKGDKPEAPKRPGIGVARASKSISTAAFDYLRRLRERTANE